MTEHKGPRIKLKIINGDIYRFFTDIRSHIDTLWQISLKENSFMVYNNHGKKFNFNINNVVYYTNGDANDSTLRTTVFLNGKASDNPGNIYEITDFVES